MKIVLTPDPYGARDTDKVISVTETQFNVLDKILKIYEGYECVHDDLWLSYFCFHTNSRGEEVVWVTGADYRNENYWTKKNSSFSETYKIVGSELVRCKGRKPNEKKLEDKIFYTDVICMFPKKFISNAEYFILDEPYDARLHIDKKIENKIEKKKSLISKVVNVTYKTIRSIYARHKNL